AAAPEDPRDVGNRRSAEPDAEGSDSNSLSRQKVRVRLCRVSATGRSGATVQPARGGTSRARSASDRGLHDGPGKLDERLRSAPSRVQVFQPVGSRYRSPGIGIRQFNLTGIADLPIKRPPLN